jgi:hypothetical protein
VWNQIAQNISLAHRASLEKSALLFGKLDLAMADTAISLYDAKYHYHVWRPVTAIRLGDSASNPRITGDPNWTPLAVTAPDPSYPGAHSAMSETAATILAAFYPDHQHLIVTSDGLPRVTRSFSSFQAAAAEAGLSRIFAGQHTRLDHNAGRKLGANVARFVLHHRNGAKPSRAPARIWAACCNRIRRRLASAVHAISRRSDTTDSCSHDSTPSLPHCPVSRPANKTVTSRSSYPAKPEKCSKESIRWRPAWPATR